MPSVVVSRHLENEVFRKLYACISFQRLSVSQWFEHGLASLYLQGHVPGVIFAT